MHPLGGYGDGVISIDVGRRCPSSNSATEEGSGVLRGGAVARLGYRGAVSWPELYVHDYESNLALMQRLGVKGGWRTDEETPEPQRIADDAKVMLRDGNVVEEWDASGLIGVHLAWDHQHHTVAQLVEMMSVDSVVYDKLAPSELRHIRNHFVPGQPRRLVVTCPKASISTFWKLLEDLRADSGDACLLHFDTHLEAKDQPDHFKKMFGGIFDSVTFRPVGARVVMPNGGAFEMEKVWDRPHAAEWVKLVGFDLEEVTLSGPLGVRNRRALSIASAVWASRHWNDTVSRLEAPPHDDEWAMKVAEMGATPELLEAIPAAKIALRKHRGASPTPSHGDMIACNSCTLFDQCRLARAGSICTLPESDMGELAEFFKTRDANRVIDGLGHLLGKQADRVEAAMAEEASAIEPDVMREDVTKMIHGLFDRGVKLAMLNDPRLKGGPQVAVSLTQNAVGQITTGSPQALAAGVVAELEARGVRREDITPELIARELGAGVDDIMDAEVVPADRAVGHLPESP